MMQEWNKVKFVYHVGVCVLNLFSKFGSYIIVRKFFFTGFVSMYSIMHYYYYTNYYNYGIIIAQYIITNCVINFLIIKINTACNI